MDKLDQFLTRAEALFERFERMLPPAASAPDWDAAIAFRWRKRQGCGFLQPVAQVSSVALSDLQNIDRQKALVEQNTSQFVRQLPANHVLLTGARGTGKSSLIKACLHQYWRDGLRLIEVDKDDLHDLADIVALIAPRSERFIIFCDDLSFDAGESSYKVLKVALDGSIAAQSENMLIYATSNRRHLLPESIRDNDNFPSTPDDEIHPKEVTEEKISLSERFGLWVSFYPFKQEDYLTIVAHWLKYFGCSAADIESARAEALVWALGRGSRSGRVAWQFARDWAGRHPLPSWK